MSLDKFIVYQISIVKGDRYLQPALRCYKIVENLQGFSISSDRRVIVIYAAKSTSFETIH